MIVTNEEKIHTPITKTVSFQQRHEEDERLRLERIQTYANQRYTFSFKLYHQALALHDIRHAYTKDEWKQAYHTLNQMLYDMPARNINLFINAFDYQADPCAMGCITPEERSRKKGRERALKISDAVLTFHAMATRAKDPIFDMNDSKRALLEFSELLQDVFQTMLLPTDHPMTSPLIKEMNARRDRMIQRDMI